MLFNKKDGVLNRSYSVQFYNSGQETGHFGSINQV